jgi:hypothetical protein
MRLRGEALGAEFRGKGVDVMLGPASGPLGRVPQGGRNWEGFGCVFPLTPFTPLRVMLMMVILLKT